MSRATYIRRLHALAINPDDLFVGPVRTTHWATDRYVLFDLATTETEIAFNCADPSGRWVLRATQTPKSHIDRPIKPPDVAQYVERQAAVEEWTPLTLTQWAVMSGNGKHNRVLVRECDGQAVTVDSDLLHRWDVAFPKGLVLAHPIDAKSSGAWPIRVSVSNEYTSNDYTRRTYTTLLGYICPTRVHDMPALPELGRRAA